MSSLSPRLRYCNVIITAGRKTSSHDPATVALTVQTPSVTTLGDARTVPSVTVSRSFHSPQLAARPRPGRSSRSSGTRPARSARPRHRVRLVADPGHAFSNTSCRQVGEPALFASSHSRTSLPTASWADRIGTPWAMKQLHQRRRVEEAVLEPRRRSLSRGSFVSRTSGAATSSTRRTVSKASNRAGLVLLQVAVVGQRQALHQHEQLLQAADARGPSCRGSAPARPGSSCAA